MRRTIRDVRALELFCGIGGLAFAAPRGWRVVAAYDQDEAAARCYETWHGLRVQRRNLESVTPAELARHEAEAWLVSPPCQPFTRRGARRDVDDPRCGALLRLIELLPLLGPRRVLVENVRGFHGSRAHARLVQALRSIGHDVRDVAACPSELGAPVRRPRHFVVSSDSDVHEPTATTCAPRSLDDCLDPRPDGSLRVPPELRRKFEDHFPRASRDGRLGTFTRSYGRALTGSGPLAWDSDGPRWLAPEEILRLHEFPASIAFPADMSRRTRWRLAGNSVHVGCVRRVATMIAA